MKFVYSSNGDGSYSVTYGSLTVAWCFDEESAIYLCGIANSTKQGKQADKCHVCLGSGLDITLGQIGSCNSCGGTGFSD